MELTQDFLKNSFLNNLPPLNFCAYRGRTQSGFQKFECERENESFLLLVSSLIRKDEDLIWTSWDELLERTLKETAQLIRGFFGFELLSLELGGAIRNFQWEQLKRLVVNHARSLAVGEEKLIQYTSLFGILKKRMPENWGKIDYQSNVSLVRKPEELDLLIKKMIKEGEAEIQGPGLTYQILVRDIGPRPLLRFGEEAQTARMEKTLQAAQAKKELPLIYVADARNFTELGDQWGLRKNV